MLFLISYKTSPATQRAGQARFVETGGAPPPAGVHKLAAYHHLDGSGGCAIAESGDPVAIARWCNQWSDILSFEVRAILTDEQLGQVLAG